MAKFEFKGVDDLIAKYQKLYDDSEEMIGKAIYEGAGVVMKDVVSAIEGISTDNRFGTPDNPTTGPNEYQKAGLRQSIGIAPMRNDGGFRNVKIGFDGYNGLHTETWPHGQPNAMIARAVESGTSWMQKQPFMRKAEQGAKAKCEAAMSEVIDREINARMNGGSGAKVGGGSGSAGASGGSGGSGSITPKSYKPRRTKTTSSKKSTSTRKPAGTVKTLKKSVARYKQLERKISDPLGSTGNLKKYGKKLVNKKRKRRK